MWEAEPAAMAEALVRHDELIADCMAVHGGRFDRIDGRGRCDRLGVSTLPRQRWPARSRPRMRSLRSDGPATCASARGSASTPARPTAAEPATSVPAINLAARLRGEADGGQILLSSVTADLVARHLPAGCALVDLGPHRLEGRGGARAHSRAQGPLGVGTDGRDRVPLPGAARLRGRGPPLLLRPRRGGLRAHRASGSRSAPGGRRRLRERKVLGPAGRHHRRRRWRARSPASARRACSRPGRDPTCTSSDDPAELIVVDQFEELFTLCDDADLRLTFIDALLSTRCPVVIGMRADMYGRLGAYPELARAVSANQLLLGAMTGDELERAVVEPAHLAGLRLEPGLVELAVREVAGEPGALPLLSHALRATWERRDGRTLTVEGYRESGGVGAAIARTADELLAACAAERRQLMRNVFVRLTDLGEDSTATRRRVRTDELVPEGVAREEVEELLERARRRTAGDPGRGQRRSRARGSHPRVADPARLAGGGSRGASAAPPARGCRTACGMPAAASRRTCTEAPVCSPRPIGRARTVRSSTRSSVASSRPARRRPTASAAPSYAPTAVCARCSLELSALLAWRCWRASSRSSSATTRRRRRSPPTPNASARRR